MSQLQQAFDVIHDKNSFQIKGSKEEKVQFHRLFKLLLQTDTGRQLLSAISESPALKEMGPIELSFIHNSDDFSGVAFADLRVQLVQIDQREMTKNQKNIALLQQSMTFVHELTHILQYLRGVHEQEINFSPINQVYANLLDESEATLHERAYEIEMVNLYPQETARIKLWKTHLKSRKEVVRAFFNGRIGGHIVGSIIDNTLKFLIDKSCFVVSDRQEKETFLNWIDKRLQKEMQVNMRHDDLPMHKVVRYQKEGYTEIWGNNHLMVIDKNGHIVCLYDGDENAFTTYKGTSEATSTYLQKNIFPVFPRSAFIHRKLHERPFKQRKMMYKVSEPEQR